MSVAGGLPSAIARGSVHGCEALQIFTKNASQWRARPLPSEEIAAFRDAARELDSWADGGRIGPRPPGHARPHDPERVTAQHGWWARRVHRAFLDPDGRPRDLRRRDAY